MHFTWDIDKAASNPAKHDGITFDEASEVFAEGNPTVDIYDDAHYEPRWKTIGPIARGLVLVVWTERQGETVHIISARLATPTERAYYRANLE